MKTEAMNTLKQIREGLNALQVEQNDQDLSASDKDLLGNLILNLDDLEDIIINNVLQDMIDKINASNEGLKKLIDDMEDSSDKIGKFSNTIQKISEAVGVLASITAKAMSVGIL